MSFTFYITKGLIYFTIQCNWIKDTKYSNTLKPWYLTWKITSNANWICIHMYVQYLHCQTSDLFLHICVFHLCFKKARGKIFLNKTFILTNYEFMNLSRSNILTLAYFFVFLSLRFSTYFYVECIKFAFSSSEIFSFV